MNTVKGFEHVAYPNYKKLYFWSFAGAPTSPGTVCQSPSRHCYL